MYVGDVSMYICMYVFIYVCVCMYICMYVHMCVYVWMCKRMYVCIDVRMYICMYVYDIELSVASSWILTFDRINVAECFFALHRRYATESKWRQTSLTWYLKGGSDLDAGAQTSTIERAFKYWSDVTPLRFTQTNDPRRANLKLRSVGNTTCIYWGDQLETSKSRF